MGKPGRPGPTLDDYLYWQERLENRVASGLVAVHGGSGSREGEGWFLE